MLVELAGRRYVRHRDESDSGNQVQVTDDADVRAIVAVVLANGYNIASYVEERDCPTTWCHSQKSCHSLSLRSLSDGICKEHALSLSHDYVEPFLGVTAVAEVATCPGFEGLEPRVASEELAEGGLVVRVEAATIAIVLGVAVFE